MLSTFGTVKPHRQDDQHNYKNEDDDLGDISDLDSHIEACINAIKDNAISPPHHSAKLITEVRPSALHGTERAELSRDETRLKHIRSNPQRELVEPGEPSHPQSYSQYLGAKDLGSRKPSARTGPTPGTDLNSQGHIPRAQHRGVGSKIHDLN